VRSLARPDLWEPWGRNSPGLRGLEKQRDERAIALSIALGQLSLKVGVDAVKFFQRSMSVLRG
jgi:hypothetical protein